jgi:hypothetical protein
MVKKTLILVDRMEYEGDTILGVFDTMEQIKEQVKNYENIMGNLVVIEMVSNQIRTFVIDDEPKEITL